MINVQIHTTKKARNEKVRKDLLLCGEMIGAASFSTGAKHQISTKDIKIINKQSKSVMKGFKLASCFANKAKAGKIIMVIIAHRIGELECAPPAVWRTDIAVNKAANVPQKTPNNHPKPSVKTMLMTLIVNISIAYINTVSVSSF